MSLKNFIETAINATCFGQNSCGLETAVFCRESKPDANSGLA